MYMYVYCVLFIYNILENLLQRPYEVCTVQEALCQYSFLPKMDYSVLIKKQKGKKKVTSPPDVSIELLFKCQSNN